MSVTASPEITRNVSSRNRSAFLTLPAVPSGSSSVVYVSARSRSEPSPKKLRMMLARNCTVMTTSFIPLRRNRRRMWCSMGWPMIGSMGLGWLLVSGRRRVPCPPAITTAFTPAS